MAAGVKIFFDGGWRPASGMEIAIVAGGRVVVTRDLGPGSAMDAEWLALIAALRQVHALGVADAILLGDAAAVIAQAEGRARCPPAMAQHLETFHSVPRPPGQLRIRHVKRTQNLAGIALAARRRS